MAVYAIIFQLNGPKTTEAAGKLQRAIQEFDHFHDPDIDSLWLIESNHFAQTLYKNLYKALEAPDRLLIVNMNKGFMTASYSGQLGRKAQEWVNDRVKSLQYMRR